MKAGRPSGEAVKRRMSEVTRLTAEGHTAKEIGARLGVCERTVHRMRRRAGVSQAPADRCLPLTPEKIALFDALLTDGWSYKEIAQTHHVSPETLARRFPGRGWTDAQKVELREGKRLLEAIPSTYLGRPSSVPETYGTIRALEKGGEARRAKPRGRRRIAYSRTDRMVG